MTRATLLTALCLVLLTCLPAWAAQDSLTALTQAYARQAQAGLANLDRGLAQAAGELAKQGLAGEGARRVLHGLVNSCPLAIDACTIDTTGRMLTIEPKAYHHLEGSDISNQEQVRQLWQTRRPVMSQVFRAVEGVDVVDLEHPVFNDKGELLGAVSVIFCPQALLSAAWNKVESARGLEPWAMDAVGRIIYDLDPREVGRMLLDDELYRDFTELLAMGRRMLAEPQGQGVYSFPPANNDQAVSKACAWASVELHGAWWRLVVAQPQR